MPCLQLLSLQTLLLTPNLKKKKKIKRVSIFSASIFSKCGFSCSKVNYLYLDFLNASCPELIKWPNQFVLVIYGLHNATLLNNYIF